MYLNHVSKGKINKFIKSIDTKVNETLIKPSEDKSSIKVFCLNHVFFISDFEFKDIKQGQAYSKQFRKFMITLLDEKSTELGNEYIDNLHSYLEKDNVYGSII